MSCSNKKIVITGLGAITPLGNSVSDTWESACNGKSGIVPTTSFDATEFASRISGQVKNFDPALWQNKKTIKKTDKFVQYGIAAAKQALADSGLEITEENAARVGVIVGSGIGGIETIEKQYKIFMERGPSRLSPFLIPMLLIDLAAGCVSIETGAKGPNMAMVTACATGTHCIGEAMNSIQRGDMDVCIAGGTESAISALGVGGFCAMKALSTRNDEPARASRPFDKGRDGFVMAEGSGIVIVESEEHALKRGAKIYAELVGYGASGDAHHITQPAPGGEGYARALRMSLDRAGIAFEKVDYINAHGTSTYYNDIFETQAIKKVFKDHAYKLMVSSTKSMTGHMLGAAGGVEFVLSCLAIKNSILPPTINYEEADPECDLDYIPNTAREKNITYAVSSSLGFGGHNACLIVKKY
ncbi:MAG: beta-ketoacyl-ACP synthase II [Candidatus Aureabacteria bacterium]|nr:beta-ketoacyl-ACP synthase II [Candidatus Auribacterota bacterium]